MELFVIDAFTDAPFAGNPAAVCLLSNEPDAIWLQNVACEMNLSETAFLSPRDGEFGLRWFTPAYEVELCGHATLASAHALWTECGCEAEQIRFHTRSGVLTATRSKGKIELDFPATPPSEAAAPDGLLAALGLDQPVFLGKSKFDRFVVVESEENVRALTPDFGRLREIEMRGVIVTSVSSDPRYDFLSRYFAPAAGIDEDPVTGSAHCCLAPYWSERLGKQAMTAFQASSRGGVVHVQREADRVRLGGGAVTVLRGELLS